jgi:dTDP-glucose 4,6-dehydratase
MARVLVAGAAGFIGSHLTDRLLADGHEVHGVDNFVTGSPRNLAHLHGHPRFAFTEADVTQPISIDGPFDRVYHLASPASPIDYLELPFETMYAGSDATRVLLDVALRDQARFLLASTSEVYGDPMVHPQVETYFGNVNSIGPRSVYDEAKRYAEAITMAYHRYRGVETRIVRIFNTYGPRMRLNDGRVIPAFCGQALRGEPLTLFGDGSQTRSLCYVTDLVDGLVRLMESDLRLPCNVGNPHERTVAEIASIIKEKAGSNSEMAFLPLPQDDPKQRRPDITRAHHSLGWEPRVDFTEGLESTLEYFRSIL